MSVFNRKILRGIPWLFMAAIVSLVPLTPQFSFAQGDPPVAEQQAEEQTGQIFLPFAAVEQSSPTGQITPNLDEHSADEHSHIGQIPEEGRFTLQGQQWPPQPKYIQEVQVDVASSSTAQVTASQRITERLAASSALQALLGERYVYLGSQSLVDKAAPELRATNATYFSHSNNVTLEVLLNQGDVEEITSLAPEAYQPPLGEQEVIDAVAIARTQFVADGIHRVADLEGFGILALPTDGLGTFFDTRVVYVSFHEHADAPPEYLAWVDLTNQVVTQSRED